MRVGGTLGRDGQKRLVAAALLSVAGWVLLHFLAPPTTLPWTPEMLDAAGRMQRGLEETATYCQDQGISVDRIRDPGGTCLIGPQLTPLVTSLGQLEAKRTTVNPDVAGLMVHLLRQAGVSAGDTVAIGASASFPGFLLATLVAVDALGAEPVTILSLGASSYGATRTELNLLALHDLWKREGVVGSSVTAVSLGGSEDVGGEFEEEVRAGLRQQIEAGGIPLIDDPVLTSNVAQRVGLSGGAGVFVNIGGGQVNMGTSAEILGVPPGLSLSLKEMPSGERGVLFEMVSRGVPVIHLLHVRGLALQYGLPWDPVPLPAPGTTILQSGEGTAGLSFWILTIGYLSSLLLLFLGAETVRRRPQ